MTDISQKPLLIHDAAILTNAGRWEHGWLLIEQGKIAQMGEGVAPTVESAQRIDGRGQTALPGFIDLHVHGAVSHDTMDATPEALTAMARFFATHGVTSFLATTMTAANESTLKALQNVARHMGRISGGATLLGAHLEGPYVNLAMKGAQEGKYIRRADPLEYLPWLETNAIKQITVAPEFPENRSFMAECARRAINISIGHTQATYDDVLAAIALGARQATHTFNAMTALHHRTVGTVGAVLASDPIICELIADNIHVHPAALKIAVRAKGVPGIVLITDAIRGAGMSDGLYELGGQPVTVINGTATLKDGTLAGSILTMDRALKNILAATGLTLADAWPMLSYNAARQIGLANSKGLLRPGYDADIVLLDETCNVVLTMAEGRIVHQQPLHPGA